MISGTVHSYWPAVFPEGLDDKRPVLEQSLKSMRELVKPAEDHGIILNVEVINRFEQFVLNTSAEAVSYVEEINSPSCRILLDTFYMNIEEDSLEDAIKLAGPLVMEPFVRPGGKVGRDIAVWRDLMPGADLDSEAAKAVEFVKKQLVNG